MIFRRYHTGVLQDQLDGRIVCQSIKPCPFHGLEVSRLSTRIVVCNWRVSGEIISKNPLDFEMMSLKKSDFGHHKSDVVDIRHHFAAIYASSAGVNPNSDGEQKGVIDG